MGGFPDTPEQYGIGGPRITVKVDLSAAFRIRRTAPLVSPADPEGGVRLGRDAGTRVRGRGRAQTRGGGGPARSSCPPAPALSLLRHLGRAGGGIDGGAARRRAYRGGRVRAPPMRPLADGPRRTRDRLFGRSTRDRLRRGAAPERGGGAHLGAHARPPGARRRERGDAAIPGCPPGGRLPCDAPRRPGARARRVVADSGGGRPPAHPRRGDGRALPGRARAAGPGVAGGRARVRALPAARGLGPRARRAGGRSDTGGDAPRTCGDGPGAASRSLRWLYTPSPQTLRRPNDRGSGCQRRSSVARRAASRTTATSRASSVGPDQPPVASPIPPASPPPALRTGAATQQRPFANSSVSVAYPRACARLRSASRITGSVIVRRVRGTSVRCSM